MHRFFSDPLRSTDEDIFLSPEDAKHALTVLRLKAGQHIEVIHEGRLMEAEIAGADSHDVRARFVSFLPSAETAVSFTLYQGLPKGDKMDFVVQKATELGVCRIVPVLMDRCVSRPDPKDLSRKTDRWRRIIREAAKQSGRCMVPVLSDPVSLRQVPSLCGIPETNVVPWEEAGSYGPLAFQADHPSLSSLGILIGPEGGIEKDEIAVLRSAGFVPITLGKRILRTETAGIAAAAALMSLYGEME